MALVKTHRVHTSSASMYQRRHSLETISQPWSSKQTGRLHVAASSTHTSLSPAALHETAWDRRARLNIAEFFDRTPRPHASTPREKMHALNGRPRKGNRPYIPFAETDLKEYTEEFFRHVEETWAQCDAHSGICNAEIEEFFVRMRQGPSKLLRNEREYEHVA